MGKGCQRVYVKVSTPFVPYWQRSGGLRHWTHTGSCKWYGLPHAAVLLNP